MPLNVVLALPYTPNPHGGVEVVAYNTVHGLKRLHSDLEKNDVHITVVSTKGYSNGQEFEEYSHLDLVHFKFPPGATLVGCPYSQRKNKELFKNADILHAHDIYNACAGIRNSVPSILTLHGIYWKEQHSARSSLRDFAYYNLSTFLFKKIFPSISIFVSISPYVFRELIENGLNPEEVHVELLENPISDLFFDIKKRFREKNLIWYPGVISKRKNQLAMIYVARQLLKLYGEDFLIVFTGGILDMNYFVLLRNAITKYKLSKNVFILGKVPYSQILDLYTYSSVVVLLSRQETAPMVISEALATKTPVVVSPVGGVPYMVDDGVDGFIVDPNDPQFIAERISWLLGDKSLWKRMGKKGKQKALKRWKEEVIIGRLITMYNSLGGVDGE